MYTYFSTNLTSYVSCASVNCLACAFGGLSIRFHFDVYVGQPCLVDVSRDVVYKWVRTRAASFRHVNLITETRMRICVFYCSVSYCKSISYFLHRLT